ncbi:MAG TPA: hypothetical protein DEQ03_05690 [Marinilabiliales bacterium]|nr:hypothetical protein [Marinilabiliales bacterium]
MLYVLHSKVPIFFTFYNRISYVNNKQLLKSKTMLKLVKVCVLTQIQHWKYWMWVHCIMAFFF